MNIINFNGGLGNQLFQYSFGMAIKYEFGHDVKFCDRFINKKQIKIQDIFNVDYKLANSNDYSRIIGNLLKNEYLRSYFLRIIRKSGVREFKNFIIENYNHPFSSLPSLNNKYFYGYWQNFEFFFKHLNSIKNNLKFKNENNLDYLFKDLKSSYTDTVCLHLRLGDYKSYKNKKVYSDIPENYYHNAINKFEKKLKKPIFIVFSDQIELVDKTLINKNNVITASSFNLGAKSDFYLMSLCDAFIFSNSTFSLWAAYISNKKRLFVTRPLRWFKNDVIQNANKYYLDTWIYL